jgi:hypothetical protein
MADILAGSGPEARRKKGRNVDRAVSYSVVDEAARFALRTSSNKYLCMQFLRPALNNLTNRPGLLAARLSRVESLAVISHKELRRVAKEWDGRLARQRVEQKRRARRPSHSTTDDKTRFASKRLALSYFLLSV